MGCRKLFVLTFLSPEYTVELKCSLWVSSYRTAHMETPGHAIMWNNKATWKAMDVEMGQRVFH